MACLRRSSPLSFIPLEPYPARFARHLPHAGKALSVVILFPHMRVFVLTMREKRHPRFVAFPIGEGGPRQRHSGTLVNGALVTLPYCSFCEGRTMAIAGEIASVRGWASHFRGGVSSESVALPCFLRCVLISHYFFPRRRSPVIMDRDSISGGQLCHRVLCRRSPVRNAGRRRLSSYGIASIQWRIRR